MCITGKERLKVHGEHSGYYSQSNRKPLRIFKQKLHDPFDILKTRLFGEQLDGYELVLGTRVRLVGGVKAKGEEEQKLSVSPGFEVCWEEESEAPFPERLTKRTRSQYFNSFQLELYVQDERKESEQKKALDVEEKKGSILEARPQYKKESMGLRGEGGAPWDRGRKTIFLSPPRMCTQGANPCQPLQTKP